MCHAGAVSHQVKALETELGLKLFTGERQRLVITEAGHTYLETVRDALDCIAAGTERLLQRQRSGVLTVSTSPNFAAKWLVHRLASFAEAHPDVELRISAAPHHVDFAREDVELAIRHGDGALPGPQVTRLCAEELVIVCSPRLMKGRHPLHRPADLAHHTLLHTKDRTDWSRWLEAVGTRVVDASKAPIFNQVSMVLDVAVDGQGVCYCTLCACRMGYW